MPVENVKPIKQSSPHAMVAVPEGIRIILRETARQLIIQQQQQQQSTTTTKNHRYRPHRPTRTVNVYDLLNHPQKFPSRMILSEDVIMRDPGYPPYRASVMDGYALSIEQSSSLLSSSEEEKEEWTHVVVDKVLTGATTEASTSSSLSSPTSGKQLPFAYYITTGAVVPDTCDCVVPVEEVKISPCQNYINTPFSSRQQTNKWIRAVGFDIPAQTVVLQAGRNIMDAVALGLLRQAGVPTIQVVRPIKVGVLSTGNELLCPSDSAQQWNDGSHHPKGTIPDVNRPMLLNLLAKLTPCPAWKEPSAKDNSDEGEEEDNEEHVPICTPVDLGMARDDDVNAMTTILKQAIDGKGVDDDDDDGCDIVITTGGISMGETDIVEDVLVHQLNGTHHFGRIHMKPGKPSTFVSVPKRQQQQQQPTSSCLVFALPGNPVSAFVCTQLLVRPCLDLLWHGPDTSADTHGESLKEQLDRMVSNATAAPLEVSAVLSHDIPLDKERPEYHRVILSRRSNGHSPESGGLLFTARTTGNQQSSRLMSCRDAEALLVLSQATPERPKAVKGETYTCLVLDQNRRKFASVQPLRVCESKHLGGGGASLLAAKTVKSARLTRVGVTTIVVSDSSSDAAGEDEKAKSAFLLNRVEKALSGSKSGSISIVASEVYHFNTDKSNDSLYDHLQASSFASNLDIHVVVYSQFHQSLVSSLELSKYLKSKLTKIAPALALQARRGAAAKDPTAALFEVVVGFLLPPPPPTKDDSTFSGSLVILLAEEGLDGGLDNVRGLLKHAFEIAQGSKCKNASQNCHPHSKKH